MRSNRRIALIGAPNAGKTTLYNWLTNSKFKTVNYPGATVEYAVGLMISGLGEEGWEVVDTPGTYSLFAKSDDEEVTLKVLTQGISEGAIDQVILVVDGTQLARHLLLARQLQMLKVPFSLVLTMPDLLKNVGLTVDAAALESEFGAPVVLFDGVSGAGLSNIPKALKKVSVGFGKNEVLKAWTPEEFQNIQMQISVLSEKVMKASKKSAFQDLRRRTDQFDRVLLHPIFGLVLFFLIMAGLFTSIYTLATPFMDLIDGGLSDLAGWIKETYPDRLWAEFLADGFVMGFAAVVVFVPQIFILFFGVGFLESSGYLARAATLIDQPFSKIGLSGRSFVPVLSGFACAVPALMATRNLSSKRDRLITNMIIPLMTCSARLPVYALLLAFLFQGKPSWQAGFALALLYFGALILGAIGAAILNRILPVSSGSHFMMELPLYRAPRWGVLFHQTLKRSYSYVRKAGPIIFVLAVVLWFGTTFPRNSVHDEPGQNVQVETQTQTQTQTLSENPEGIESITKVEAQHSEVSEIEQSYLGKVGRYIEPIFEPMGVDWRVGLGLLTAFAAREVFVSSLAIVFHVAEDDESLNDNLLKSMSLATNSKGEKILTVSSVVGLLIFFMIALQCISTVGVQIRESGSWNFAMVQLVLFNVVAYGLAVAAVQGLRSMGVS